MKKFLCVLLCSLCVFSTLGASTFSTQKPFAFFLSAVAPGMGQVYLGDPEKGIAIWSASSLLGMGVLVSVGRIQFGTLNGMIPGHIGFQIRDDLDFDRLFWVGSLSITYLILYFYNLMDVANFEEPYPELKIGAKEVSASIHIGF